MQLIKKDLGKYIKPFIIWSFVGYLVFIAWQYLFYKDLTLRHVFYVPIRSFLLTASMPLNGALWFIPILFCVRQVFRYSVSKVPVWIILTSSAVLTIFLTIFHIPYMPAWISSTAWGACFFAPAYMLKGKESNSWLLIVCTCIFAASFFTNIPATYHDGGTTIENLLWYPCCLSACVVFNYVIQRLVHVCDKFSRHKPFPVLSYIGKHSMVFYCCHYIVFKVVADLNSVMLPDIHNKACGVLITYSACLLVGYVITLWQGRRKNSPQRGRG